VQGVTRAGPWRLKVADTKLGDTGILKSWCIEAR
jgi:subtilisin-like proprotein convertase family protein